MAPILIYMTCADQKEASIIVKQLLSQKLIACANIMAPHRAVYYWQGDLQEDHEIVVIAKSEKDKFKDICDAVSRIHSYDVPCLLEIPVTNGLPSFFDFIKGQITD